jgi:hypothetical protein
MSGKLSQILRGKQPAPRRVMVYGTQGIGKSTFGAAAPGAVFVPTEDGVGLIDCAKFPLARSYGDVMAALRELQTEAHEFRTVVIDSLDWLERLVFEEVCAGENVTNIERIGYQKGYTFALNYWRPLLAQLDELRFSRQMGVVLIAHAKVEKFQTPEDAAFDRFSPRLHKLASALVQEWCDEVFFCTYSAASNPQKVRNAEPERLMRTSEGPTHVAKNRLGMPAELPLEWAAYQYFIEQAYQVPAVADASTTGAA